MLIVLWGRTGGLWFVSLLVLKLRLFYLALVFLR